MKYSRPVRTKAVLGDTKADQSDDPSAASEYHNSVISLQTSLDVQELFELTRKVETELGRVRSGRWAARTVDLDVLLFGNQVIETDLLVIPHPRMSFRRFVLQGAVEVAPDMLHPQSQVTLKALLERIDSGPRKVLWLASDSKNLDEAQGVKDELTKNPEGPFCSGPKCCEIDIHTQVSVKDLEQQPIEPQEYCLLLYSGRDQEFSVTARWFAGPALNLINCSSPFLSREIVAAVEAMF